MTSVTACDERIETDSKPPELILTSDQESAIAEIEAAFKPGEFFLLTGNAGSGKTTLIQHFTKRMTAKKKDIVLTAPTHKAVSVLKKKLDETDLAEVPCVTIHSLLSLRPKPYGDRQVFERDRHAQPVTADIVIVDECSMIDSELYRHIKRHLPMAFVVFVGDPAQLPPVNEAASLTFSTADTTHLTTIVRQAADNPILAAAHVIRESQGGEPDWSWCNPTSTAAGLGVFKTSNGSYSWMQKAFTSKAFEDDPDTFRYLAWTNQRVREINELVRRWRYGDDIPTPFMPGERALFTAPVIQDKNILFANREEATVITIKPDTFTHKIPAGVSLPAWTAQFAAWCITLRNTGGAERTVHMPADEREYQKVINRIKDEAADDRYRWKHYHDLKERIAHMQSIYALTVHSSQGATFGSVFIDVPNIRLRERSDLLEAQKLAYVAVTRASQRVMLVGV